MQKASGRCARNLCRPRTAQTEWHDEKKALDPWDRAPWFLRLSCSGGFLDCGRERDHPSTPVTRNPFHLRLEPTGNVELDHLCHCHPPIPPHIPKLHVRSPPACVIITWLDAEITELLQEVDGTFELWHRKSIVGLTFHMAQSIVKICSRATNCKKASTDLCGVHTRVVARETADPSLLRDDKF